LNELVDVCSAFRYGEFLDEHIKSTAPDDPELPQLKEAGKTPPLSWTLSETQQRSSAFAWKHRRTGEYWKKKSKS